MARFNPFTPNNPVNEGMFVGRLFELNAIEKALVQTEQANPSHLLLLGERGIGKTSLLNVVQIFARGQFKWGDTEHNFLSVRVSIDTNLTLLDFVIKLKKAIEREIQKENPDVALFKKAWEFLSRFEVSGVAYKKDETIANENQIIQESAYAIADTIKNLKESTVIKNKSGLVILIDEGDRSSKLLNLGSFLKNLSETLIAEGENNALFIVSGLPDLRDVLMTSHESSLRLFQELTLKPLSRDETGKVISRGLEKAEKESGEKISIEDDAVERVYEFSEGYPHFVQQVGYSAFDTDKDSNITADDVKDGFFMDHGALEQIGDRYYVKIFYKDISSETQREILSIMAEKWNDWIKRDEIKKKFKGSENALDSSLKALRDKNIIIPRDGYKGQYRLQWGSFAFWIGNHDKEKHRS